jgi:ribonuclease R
MTKGSLDLDMPETKIFVNEEGYADRIELITHDESHQLIEEFMLAANEAVARTLLHANVPLVHRVHEKPDPEKLDELREYMMTVGIETGDLTKRKEIVNLLQKIKAHAQGHVLRIQFLRSLRQANYSAEALGHYGLFKQHYTHFTSPIRRYSDLIVHRIFDAYLKKRGDATATAGARFYSQAELSKIAQHLTLTEQNSTEAERESVKIKQLEFFERETALPRDQRRQFEAIIVDVRNHGMFVELSESLAYGMVSLSTLEDDLYVLNRQGNRMTGKGKKRQFSVGQKIRVMAHRVERYKRQIDFAVCE